MARASPSAMIRPSLIATLPSNVAVPVTTVAPEITRSATGVMETVISSQIGAAEVHERIAFGRNQNFDHATDDNANSVALDHLLELAVHRAERVLQHRRPGS